MTKRRPGRLVRALTARWCSQKTMTRLVDPSLADLQAEYDEATRNGHQWRRRWVWVVGHLALGKVVMWCAGEGALAMLQGPNGEDRQSLIRSLKFSLTAVAVSLVLLLMPITLSLDVWTQPSRTWLMLLCVPQAIPLALPMGLVLGTLGAFGTGRASRRARCSVMLVALAASIVSLTTLAWVTPAANQAFRVTTAGGPVPKGPNELSLSELRERLTETTETPVVGSLPVSTNALRRSYHMRWAISFAPLALTLFALSVTSRGPLGRLLLGTIGGTSLFGYYVLLYAAIILGLDPTVPAFAQAWAPNVAFGVMAVALAMRKSSSLEAASMIQRA